MKKLCAALLRSFWRQHSEKMKESALGNWDPRESQQPFRPNPNGVGYRTTTLRRLLIGAGQTATVLLLLFFLSNFDVIRYFNNRLLIVVCSVYLDF